MALSCEDPDLVTGHIISFKLCTTIGGNSPRKEPTMLKCSSVKFLPVRGCWFLKPGLHELESQGVAHGTGDAGGTVPSITWRLNRGSLWKFSGFIHDMSTGPRERPARGRAGSTGGGGGGAGVLVGDEDEGGGEACDDDVLGVFCGVSGDRPGEDSLCGRDDAGAGGGESCEREESWDDDEDDGMTLTPPRVLVAVSFASFELACSSSAGSDAIGRLSMEERFDMRS
jgi:hypothetical protein